MMSLGFARYRLQLCVEPYLSDLLILQDRIRHSSLCKSAVRGQQSGPSGLSPDRPLPPNISAKKLDIHFSVALFVDIAIYISHNSQIVNTYREPGLALTGDGALPTFRLDAEPDLYRAQAVARKAYELRGSVL
jgi:hypothetical protein